MGVMTLAKQVVKGNIVLYKTYNCVRYVFPAKILGMKWDVYETQRKYKKAFGRPFDLKNPKTLNEKIQWLKLTDRKEFHTVCADKLAVRDYWKKYGEEGLIPLYMHTNNPDEITYDSLPDVPCIVKCNSGSGSYEIIHDKNTVNFKELQKKCKRWLAINYYYVSQEWQYKDIQPCIIVEKLLLDSKGHIPNDYKLHFINGELQFIYCSVDREGENYRCIYSPEWERMEMEWVAPKDHKGITGADIPKPATFEQMLMIGKDVASNFRYVRVDFYDVEGKLYYGEITLHHGSGFDTFVPEKWDLYYGEKLKL